MENFNPTIFIITLYHFRAYPLKSVLSQFIFTDYPKIKNLKNSYINKP